jgi:glycosyltransferase involved in cell wall biosynthesis
MKARDRGKPVCKDAPRGGPDVTVVVPARNEEERLPLCLARLREQTFPGFELLVVDSASTDRTLQVARAFGANVISLREPGVGRARQAGFQAAQGAIIASTDADALPSQDWLERLIVPFRDPAVVGSFGTLRFTPDEGWLRIGHAFFSRFQKVNKRLGRPLCCGPNFAVRKTAFLEVGGFAAGVSYPNDAEDIRLALKLRAVGDIVFLPDVTMAVSPRSVTEGRFLKYFGHHAWVYLKVCWLERRPKDLSPAP